MKKLLSIIVAFSTIVAFAADKVEIRITNQKGQTNVKTVELKDVGKGVERLEIPIRDIPIDTKHIDVVHQYAKAKKGDEGYWVFPNGMIGSFRLDNAKYSRRHQPLHVHGVKTKSKTIAAIATGLKFEYSLNVVVKNGNYEIFPRYEIAKMGFAPYEDIIIDFYKLEGSDANYSGMARTYRKYQLDRGEVVPLRERIKNNPTLDFTTKSTYVRIKLGRCDRRKYPYELWGKQDFPLVVDHTFDDVQNILKRLKNIGVDWAEVCLVGWLKGGHDGPFPDMFPIPQEFGGEAKMLETIKLGKELGYRMTVHVNHTSFYYGKAKRLPLEDVCKDLKGEPRKYTFWPGGQAYNSCFQTVCNRLIDEDIAKFKEMGLNGSFHVDVTSAREPTPCHDPRHPNNRKQMAQWQNKVNQKLRDAFGGYSSERALDHVAKTLDYGLYVTWQGLETLRQGYGLIDHPIPLTELVYHGIILTNPFYGTIDAPYERGEDKFSDVKESYAYLDTPANRVLKVIEYGGRPSYYYIDYSDLEPLRKFYIEYEKIKHLQTEFMQSHRMIEKNVYETTYESGTRIICNYNDTPVKFEGNEIKPKWYIMLKK